MCAFTNESLHALIDSSSGTESRFSPGFIRRTRSFEQQLHRKTTSYLLSGWDCAAEPAANSSSDRPRWTSRPPSSFPPVLPPDFFSAQVGAPNPLPLQCIFLQRGYFSLRLLSVSLRVAPSSSGPDVGTGSYLCRQLALYYSCAWLNVSSPSIALLQTTFQRRTVLPNLLLTFATSNNRPERTACPLASLPLVASVLQLLDRKLQSAVIVLPPGYKLAGLNCTVI